MTPHTYHPIAGGAKRLWILLIVLALLLSAASVTLARVPAQEVVPVTPPAEEVPVAPVVEEPPAIEVEAPAVEVPTSIQPEAPYVIAAPTAIDDCEIDTDGANDPSGDGQKDMTTFCVDPLSGNPLQMYWNWDDTSSNNSADACALFDTDGDKLADYALCNEFKGTTQATGYPKLYLCTDAKPLNCSSPTEIAVPAGTTCTLGITNTDPFAAGNYYPHDMTSMCTVYPAAVGGGTLLDVCSYTSASPSSVASDCVVRSTNNGNLEIKKDVVPDDSSMWTFTVTGPTGFISDPVADGDSTGNKAVLGGTYTIKEAPTGDTKLDDYTPTWKCSRTYECGSNSCTTTSSGTGDTISNIDISNADIWICTFTNTRKTGSLQIVKNVVPDDSATNWDFAWTGPTPGSCSIAGDGFCDAATVNTGSYAIVETAGDATSLDDYDTTWVCTKNGTAFDPALSGSGTSISGVPVGKDDAVVCTFTNTHKQYADLTVTKTASAAYSRTYAWEIDKDVDTTRATFAFGGSATFNYTVGVTHDAGTDSGWTVSGDITVYNTNPFAFEGVNITDAVDVEDAGACTVTDGTNVTVPAAVDVTPGSVTRSYTCTFASNPGTGTNTASATWNAATYYTLTGSASGTAPYNFAQATVSDVDECVDITDTFAVTAENATGTLGRVCVGDTTTSFTYAKQFSGVGGTCTDYDNTATFTTNDTGATDSDSESVSVCVGVDLIVTKTATASYDRTYHWTIAKAALDDRIEIANGGTATFNYGVTVTPNGYTDSGWTLSGSITVNNPNDWEAITADITDAVNVGGGAVCTVTGGTAVVVPAATVAGPGSVTRSYSCTFTEEPLYEGVNTATATWVAATYFTPTGTASGNADVDFALHEDTYETITVVDDKIDQDPPVELGTWDWADGEHTFTYTLGKSGVAGTCTDYTNIAKIVETEQTATETVTVCVGLDLAVTKTASASYDREYLWDISKSVDDDYIIVAPKGKATFDYTVRVWQTGILDSDWEVHGVITINNPNDWEAITLTSLADEVNNDGTCIVDAGPYEVPASGSINVAYSCTYAAQPASYSGTNTAATTWDKDAYFTPTGSDSGTANFEFEQDVLTNETVNVTDTYGGALGAVTATDATPWATATFNYSYDHAGVAGACMDYTNIATITETLDTATETVTVCVPSIALNKQISTSATGPWSESIEVLPGKNLYYRLVVTNDGPVPLDSVTVTDPALPGYTCTVPAASLPLLPGKSYTCPVAGPVDAVYNYNEQSCNTATAAGTAETITVTDTDTACYKALYWGFTPGFWKNHYKDPRNAWSLTEYGTSDGVCGVFSVPADYGGRLCKTLQQALSFKGGKGVDGAAQTLLRAGVASLLNASFNETYVAPDHPAAVKVWDVTLGRYVLMSCDPGASGCADPVVYWPYTSQGVIDAVNAALARLDRNTMLMLATELDGYNNGTHWIDWTLLQ